MKIIKKYISFSSLLILLLTFYCTDVCPSVQVDWIVQFTAPISTADYIHRVGRTARIGEWYCPVHSAHIHRVGRTARIGEWYCPIHCAHIHSRLYPQSGKNGPDRSVQQKQRYGSVLVCHERLS